MAEQDTEEHTQQEQKRMGAGMLVLAWIAFGAVAVYWFDGLLERQRNPNTTLSSTIVDGVREVRLQRNRAGHYVADGTINGRDVTFVLDTGATTIAIPGKVAANLALPRGEEFKTHTANGIASSFAIRLDRVSIGDIALRNVPAGVSPGLSTDEVLLGMSFLKHIEFTQRGDTLILRQYVED